MDDYIVKNAQEFPITGHYVVIMVVIGIIVNLLVSRYVIKIGKEIGSPAIVANAEHQKIDIFSSIAILFAYFTSNIQD